MSPRLRIASDVVLLTCVVFLAGFTVHAQKGNSSSLTSAQREMVAAPRAWTREEMLAAKPYPMPQPDRLPADGYQMSVRPTGPQVSQAGGLPDTSQLLISSPNTGPSSALSADEAASQELLEPDPAAAPAFTYPYPYSRWENPSARYIDYPFRTVGKVFFTKFGGGNFVCSASSIGNYAVITAGHCVSDGLGHYHSNWVFVPRYFNGTAPDGQWTANHLWVRIAWHTGGANDWQEDIGGAVLNKLGTLKISQKVGYLGWIANAPLQQQWFSIGYPATAPFTGNRQIICATSYAKTDIIVGAFQTYGFGCDATGGASGGPVIRKFAHGIAGSAINLVNGVNSYKYTATQPQALYSPWFGSNAVSIINCLRNSGPGVQKCTAPAAP
jgi:V8-like Glu-specific endopeptidase